MTTTRAVQPGQERPLAAIPGGPLGRLGSWSYRHRRLVALAWVAVLVLISLAGRLAGSAFKDDLNGGTATLTERAVFMNCSWLADRAA